MSKPDEAVLFTTARQIRTAEARRRYLDEACGDDPSLRVRVEALLRVHEEEPNFLQMPGASMRPPAEVGSEAAGAHIGPYKLLEQIGEGGFGIVFRAEQQQPLRRLVALKILKPGMDTRLVVARFAAERQALALMDHPNIARVFDGGETATGRPYFIMELVQGVPITHYCEDHQLAPRARLGLFVSVCQAVQHAHQKGIIHRDLKPCNVLVAVYDGQPVSKVIDFGVAKALGQPLTDRTLTTAGGMIGTLGYMSPEQADFNAHDIDTRADIYSLGVLLYELLTGTTPLTEERLKQTPVTEALRLIREEEPPKPSSRLSEANRALPSRGTSSPRKDERQLRELRGDLDWIVMKALDKDRDRRYQTANSLARDIERYLNEERVEACPPSLGYKLRKFARKNRKLLAVAAAFVMLLTAATVVSVWLAVWAIVAERAADEARDRAEAEARRARGQVYVAQWPSRNQGFLRFDGRLSKSSSLFFSGKLKRAMRWIMAM